MPRPRRRVSYSDSDSSSDSGSDSGSDTPPPRRGDRAFDNGEWFSRRMGEIFLNEEYVQCKNCHKGTRTCTKCDGTGEFRTGKECRACDGTGGIECTTCKGSGLYRPRSRN